MFQGRLVMVAILIVLSSVSALGAAVAGASSHPPSYAVDVGHGSRAKGGSWGVWIYGNREGRQCWWTQVTQGGLPQRYETCGYTVPGAPWQLASAGTVGHNESVLFFLTRPNLRGLNVRIEMSGAQSYRSIHLGVHALSAGEARAARLKQPVGYALAKIRGQIAKVGHVTVAK
jgi:hypothetical protein